jgi:nucleotide-binding universal stress UspA family protein
MTGQERPPLRCLSRLQTVLIGSSLKEGSDALVRTGAAVARAAGAKVYLVHVVPLEPMALALEAGWSESTVFQKEVDLHAAQLRDQAQRLGLHRDELAGLGVAIGPPHRVILDTARQIGADLIVVGAREAGALGKLLGSTADRVVRKAVCPVLVVRGELPVPPRRVLLPVDLSELSADAFRCGLHFLGRIGAPAEIEALYALDRDLPHEVTFEQGKRHAAWELEQVVAQYTEEAPAPVRTEVRQGEARAEILAEIERQETDLVILGTHGRSGFDRLLLGSIASGVLREAPCSVLTIPPAASLDEAIAEAVLEQTHPARHVESEAVEV